MKLINLAKSTQRIIPATPSLSVNLCLQLWIVQRTVPHRSKPIRHPAKQTTWAILGEGHAPLPWLDGRVAMRHCAGWNNNIGSRGELNDQL